MSDEMVQWPCVGLRLEASIKWLFLYSTSSQKPWTPLLALALLALALLALALLTLDLLALPLSVFSVHV